LRGIRTGEGSERFVSYEKYGNARVWRGPFDTVLLFCTNDARPRVSQRGIRIRYYTDLLKFIFSNIDIFFFLSKTFNL